MQVDTLALSANIATAYLAGNRLPAADVGKLIDSIHGALASLQEPPPAPAPKKPAVPINRSVFSDHIICLEDGAKLKMLRRYLRSRFNLTPDEYRMKWGLPLEYPMTAPAYSARRSKFAKDNGLGRSVRARAR